MTRRCSVRLILRTAYRWVERINWPSARLHRISTVAMGASMTKLISGDALRALVANEQVMSDGSPDTVEDIKYDFHLGSRVLKAEVGQPCNLIDMPSSQRFIAPGEAVFVLTRESLSLPANVTATLTPKRKLAHAGILTLGGTVIDPFYQGVLLVGLYNLSSTPFPLQAGKKLIGVMFYELDASDIRAPSARPEPILDFPDDLVRMIGSYKPVELNGMETRVAELSAKFTALQNEIGQDREWKEQVKTFIKSFEDSSNTLLNSLTVEAENRRIGDEKLTEKLDAMRESFWGLNLGKSIVFFVIVSVAAAAIGWFVNEWLTP
jgi:deoxycytidine triphosphate deaminase